MTIHHHHPPTRGRTVKFIRRPDLDVHTRIDIVIRAWLNQGIYGKMTQLAQEYHLSRTFLYHLLSVATRQLEALLSDDKQRGQNGQRQFEQLLFLLRLEGKCSIASLSSILKALDYPPNSVGYLSEFFQSYGRLLPSTLSMGAQTVVFYLSDEIFASHTPILLTLDAQSTAILKIERAADRLATTWQTHFETLDDHGFHHIGMASDRGVGLVSGYQAAYGESLWVSDQFHEFQALFNRRRQLERKAYAAIGKEDDAAEKFNHAKSESNLQKRLQQYEQAHQACEQAIARYDQLDLLLHLLREALHLCSPFGRLRTGDSVRSELTLLLSMIQELDDAKLPEILKPIQAHIDDIVVPFQQVESIHAQLLDIMPQQTLDVLVLAWHHEHLSYQSHAKKKHDHQRERQEWLNFAEGLLDGQFEPLQALVFEKLDSIVRASSLVEMVNSLIRPYLNSCKSQITQETLNLIMFYHNHRRYKSGKRKGKAPIELLTGQPLEADWVDLLIQLGGQEQDVTLGTSPPSRAPLELVRNIHERPTQTETALALAIVEPTATPEIPLQQPVGKAA
jgi:hypothetical protein